MTWMTFNTETGCITAVGRHDPPLDEFPPNLRHDVCGGRIIPGLHDSHLHVTGLCAACYILQGGPKMAPFLYIL